MNFAYADPPYVGQSKSHYEGHPDYAGEVDHTALIQRLLAEFPDGWALSCSSPSLPYLTNLLEAETYSCLRGDYRIASWMKPFAVFKPNNPVAYTWEPVIFMGGRRRGREEPTVRDHLMESITLQRGLVGVKPKRFCFWVFDLLGAAKGDTLADLFPGSSAVTRAWEAYTASSSDPMWDLEFTDPLALQ